jgi:hypothetical protein
MERQTSLWNAYIATKRMAVQLITLMESKALALATPILSVWTPSHRPFKQMKFTIFCLTIHPHKGPFSSTSSTPLFSHAQNGKNGVQSFSFGDKKVQRITRINEFSTANYADKRI